MQAARLPVPQADGAARHRALARLWRAATAIRGFDLAGREGQRKRRARTHWQLLAATASAASLPAIRAGNGAHPPDSAVHVPRHRRTLARRSALRPRSGRMPAARARAHAMLGRPASARRGARFPSTRGSRAQPCASAPRCPPTCSVAVRDLAAAASGESELRGRSFRLPAPDPRARTGAGVAPNRDAKTMSASTRYTDRKPGRGLPPCT
jgi:hypothetical protein